MRNNIPFSISECRGDGECGDGCCAGVRYDETPQLCAGAGDRGTLRIFAVHGSEDQRGADRDHHGDWSGKALSDKPCDSGRQDLRRDIPGGGAASGGEIEITGVEPVVLVEPLKALRKMGAGLRIFGAAGPKARIRMVMERRPAGITIDTGPYPGFPTVLQSVFLAAEASGTGESQIRETVYEARFEAAVRLASFGADVSVHGDTAIIKGRYPLLPGVVETPDLRGGAALLVAALSADGLSVVSDRGHLKRGYEDIGRDLRILGADIEENIL